jgi:hypothetical protein
MASAAGFIKLGGSTSFTQQSLCYSRYSAKTSWPGPAKEYLTTAHLNEPSRWMIHQNGSIALPAPSLSVSEQSQRMTR